MDARLQRRVQRYGWDKAAGCYEQYWADQLAPAQDRLLALAELRPGEHVLDVACGTGLVTMRAAAAVGTTGQVLATDISGVMVEQLRGAVAARGLTQVRVEQGDAETLPVDDGEFHAALCALGLMYVADPGGALRHMYGALRPHGRMVVAVWGARARCGWAEVFPIVEGRVASDVCPLFFQLGTGDALSYELARVGLTDVHVERIATPLRYASDDEACGAAFAGGPVALAYSHFDGETRAAVHEEYLASVAPYRKGAGYEIPGEFVVARGWRQ